MDHPSGFQFYHLLPIEIQHRILVGNPKDIRSGRQLNKALRERLKYDKIRSDLSLPITLIEVLNYLETLPPTFIISGCDNDGDIINYYVDSYRLSYDRYYHELGIIYTIDGDERGISDYDDTGQHNFYSAEDLRNKIHHNKTKVSHDLHDLLTIHFISIRRLLEIGVEDQAERRNFASESTIRYLQTIVHNNEDDLPLHIFSYLLLNARLLGIRTTEESKYLLSCIDLMEIDISMIDDVTRLSERLYDVLLERIPHLHEY